MIGQATPGKAFIFGYFVILAIATVAAYSGVFQSEILRWDDKIYLNSELVQSLAMDNLISILSGKHHSNWHPLTTLSFAIENALWGMNAVYSKLTNLLLHLFNVYLFFILSYQLLLLATRNSATETRSGILYLLLEDRNKFALYSSLFAAALFSLHPQHVESVAWVSERKGLLCAIFYLSALITYIKAAEGGKRYFSGLTLVFTVLALMSKPMAISLPVAFVLLDIYPLRKINKFDISIGTIKTLLAGKLVYILLVVASIAITLLYQDPQGSDVLSLPSRLINASSAYLHYLTSVIYPENLSPFYPFLETSLQPSWSSLLPVLGFLGLAFLVLALYIKEVHFPLVIFAFYLISLLPVIGIVKVGLQAMADRYAYLPSIWFYLLIGIVISAIFVILKQARYQYFAIAIFIAMCSSLGLTTYEHSKHWQNDVLLWERVIDVYPDSASVAYVNLATAQNARGDMSMEQIEQLIIKALSISPDETYILGVAANFYGQSGEEEKALGYLLRIIEITPYNIWAQTLTGDVYFNRNDVANAGNYYLAALKHGSDSAEVIYRLALIDYHYQRYPDALSRLELLAAAKMGDRERALHKKIQDALTGSSQ